MNKVEELIKLFSALAIQYEVFYHERVKTIEDCERLSGLTGGVHVKNIFLTTRQKDKAFLALICPEKRYRTADVSKQLSVSRLSFGDEQQLKDYLDIYPGAVNPFALLYDKEKRVELVMDRDIVGRSGLLFHPNDSSASVKMDYGEFLKFVQYIGRQIFFVDVA